MATPESGRDMQHFLNYRFDDRCATLWCGPERAHLTRKAASLLQCLLARPGTVIGHDAILSAVWPDTHVHRHNIKVLIRELRRVLDDDTRSPRFIRSEAGRGYAFIAPVSDTPVTDGQDDAARRILTSQSQRLERLADALSSTARGQCRIVLIEGERGQGKTALCEAFLHSARRRPAVHAGYGQCLPREYSRVPFAPIAEALQQMVRQAPGLLASVERHAPSWCERMRARGDASDAPSLVLLIRELETLCESLSGELIALVLDDLEWSDPETLTLLDALGRRNAPLSLMIVGTYTPHLRTPTSVALSDLASDLRLTGRFAAIRLSPLREADVHEYLRQRFDAGITVLSTRLHRLCGGNARTMVAAADALVEAGVLVADGPEWRLLHPPEVLEGCLPDSVRSVLRWRFGKLDGRDRALLEAGAAAGPSFAAADVARIAGDAEALIAPRLAMLHRRGFLTVQQSGRPRSKGAPKYAFVHPLHANLVAEGASRLRQLRASDRLARMPQPAERLA